jgi:exopolyphosphatase/guanosine-5'-triphosphate,3'-diphosphate pyrophosphatase
LQVLELVPGDTPEQNSWDNLLHKKIRVQLSAGLDSYNRLTEVAMQKALLALNEFDSLLQDFKPLPLRIVGTKALRQAVNSDDFLQRIFNQIGKPAEIIDGVEEARLIYHGVANTQKNNTSRLVIDVGGGSTEFIVGEGLKPKVLDSTSIGCVTSQMKFFEDGVINAKQLRLAETQTSLKLLRLRNKLKASNWSQVIGCSGVFEALYQVQQCLLKDSQQHVTRILSLEGLECIKKSLLSYDNFDSIDYQTIDNDRKRILPAALSIVIAIFKTLEFQQLELCDAALKDGVIFELHNEHERNKTRQRTLTSLMKQYKVDPKQALRLLSSVTDVWQQLSQNWKLENPRNLLVLNWAALLHEIGQSVSPHNFPAHGAYLVANTELSGFNKSQQQLLSVLIAGQAGEIPKEMIESLSDTDKNDSWYLLIAMRLAKIIRANREVNPPAKLTVIAEGANLTISMMATDHPDVELLWAELIAESEHLKQVGIGIVLQGNLNLAT